VGKGHVGAELDKKRRGPPIHRGQSGLDLGLHGTRALKVAQVEQVAHLDLGQGGPLPQGQGLVAVEQSLHLVDHRADLQDHARLDGCLHKVVQADEVALRLLVPPPLVPLPDGHLVFVGEGVSFAVALHDGQVAVEAVQQDRGVEGQLCSVQGQERVAREHGQMAGRGLRQEAGGPAIDRIEL